MRICIVLTLSSDEPRTCRLLTGYHSSRAGWHFWPFPRNSSYGFGCAGRRWFEGARMMHYHIGIYFDENIRTCFLVSFFKWRFVSETEVHKARSHYPRSVWGTLLASCQFHVNNHALCNFSALRSKYLISWWKLITRLPHDSSPMIAETMQLMCLRLEL